MNHSARATTPRTGAHSSADRYLAKIRTLEVQESLIAGELEGARVALTEARRKVREILARQKVLRREASAIRRRRTALSR